MGKQKIGLRSKLSKIKIWAAPGRIRLRGIVILFGLLGTLSLTSLLPPDGDGANYIVLAESLANGRGYVNTVFPGDPPETLYPPLLPLFLAPLVGLLGHNYLILKLVPFAFGAAALIPMFFLLRVRWGDDMALVVTVLTAVNPFYLNIATSILSETVYLFLTLCAMLALNRSAESDGSLKESVKPALLIAASFYARTVGLTLTVASGLYLLLQRRFRWAFVLVIIQLVLIGWWGWRSVQVDSPYIGLLLKPNEDTSVAGVASKWLGLVIHNIPRYAGKVMADLAGGPFVALIDPYHPVKVGASLTLSLLFIVGFIKDLRDRVSLEGVYLLIYLGVHSLWPYHHARFLIPILPFILAYSISGLETLLGAWPHVRDRARYGMVMFLGIVGLSGCITLIYHNRTDFYFPEMKSYREACLWIKSNTPPDAVVVCRKPRMAALWSDRKAWWYTGGREAEEFVENVRRIKGSHVIVNNFRISGVNLAESFEGVLKGYPGVFQPVYHTELPRVLVYEINFSKENQ